MAGVLEMRLREGEHEVGAFAEFTRAGALKAEPEAVLFICGHVNSVVVIHAEDMEALVLKVGIYVAGEGKGGKIFPSTA